MSISNELHTINGYLHNVFSLLNFIKEDHMIKDPEISEMLDIALSREDEIQTLINKIKEESLKKESGNV